MMTKEVLDELYIQERLPVSVISKRLHTSEGRVNYWLKKFNISKRSISEAIYQRWNPKGDPFLIQPPTSLRTAILYGIGIGLYWGEGTKSNKTTIRLGNTDPRLVKMFIRFLVEMFAIDKRKLRFGLQIFSDMPPKSALQFWQKTLEVSPKQFHKVIVTPARSIGTYRNKTRHGVLTIYFNNRKLRDIICHTIENIDGTLSKIE